MTPKLVGSMGGNTAVGKNYKIVESIRQGCYEAMTAALSKYSSDDRPIRVYIDSRGIKSGQNRLNRERWGYDE
jgi:hypothetical protein